MQQLNAMQTGYELAGGELVGFGDSDTRPDAKILSVLVETLEAAPNAGCCKPYDAEGGAPAEAEMER